eukprot:COSAG01_NODE_3111_length_6570_cov_10.045743_11_plen_116_part_00
MSRAPSPAQLTQVRSLAALTKTSDRVFGPSVAQIDLGGDGGSAREEDDGIRGYSWEQDGDDVEVEVAIPADIGGKQVSRARLPGLRTTPALSHGRLFGLGCTSTKPVLVQKVRAG